MKFNREHAPYLIALCAIAAAVYSNSFGSGLVSDNAVIIARDARIRAATAENVGLIFSQNYWSTAVATHLFRPLTTLSYLVNFAIFGNGVQPAGYHWVNLLLHLANVMLVYLLALVVLRARGPAFAVAALWTVHPLLVESVTNIVGRADLLAGFGVLAGLVLHARGKSLAGIAAASTIGIFSKESAIVLLPLMLLYDVVFEKGWRTRRAAYIAAGVPVIVFLIVRWRALSATPAVHLPFTENPLAGASFLVGRITAVRVIGDHLGLLIWPLHLSSDYSYNQVPMFTPSQWQTYAASVACVAAAILAVYSYRRAKPVCFFIGIFFIALAPVANIALLIGTIKAERFLYLPAIGFAGCLVWALYALPLPKNAAPAAVAVIALALGIRTYARNSDWSTEMTLWTANVPAAPASFKSHSALGQAIFEADGNGGLDRANAEMAQSLAILDTVPDAESLPGPYINAGAFYRRKGETLTAGSAEARNWFRRSLEVLLRAERIKDANNRAHGESVYSAPLYIELARTYQRLGDPRSAAEAFRKGRSEQMTPSYSEQMSLAYYQAGQPDSAAISLWEGAILNPEYARFGTELQALYRDIDPQGCALQAGQMNMACPLVQRHSCTAAHNMAELYRRKGDESSAQRAAAAFGCKP